MSLKSIGLLLNYFGIKFYGALQDLDRCCLMFVLSWRNLDHSDDFYIDYFGSFLESPSFLEACQSCWSNHRALDCSNYACGRCCAGCQRPCRFHEQQDANLHTMKQARRSASRGP